VGVLLVVFALGACAGGGDSEPAASTAPPTQSPPPNPPPVNNPPSGTQTLNIAIEGSGLITDSSHGISCATSCVAQVSTGTTLNLAPAPESGFAFDGWSGACSGLSACMVTVGSTTSVTARFSQVVAGPASGESLFTNIASPGSVAVTLHPGSQTVLGQTTKVAFAVPFPRGLVASTSEIRVTDSGGSEIASSVQEIARWRTIAAGGAESVRSALFYVDVVFQDLSPQVLRVAFGSARTMTLSGTQPSVRSLWTSIANGPFPDEYPAADDIREPIVYATLPSDWLSQTLLVTRSSPVGQSPALAWWDAGLVNFARTAVNDVAPTVPDGNRIDLMNFEPWLYDRALTLFSVYVRTGDVKWLRHAHRAAQWYSKHVDANGIFTLASYAHDLKYSYGLSLLTDYLFTGDDLLRAPIERVAQAGVQEWQASYSASTGFWTERHHTYALLAALSAFELTGDRSHAQRATALVNLAVQMSQNAAQCPLHTVEQHEGDAGDTRLMCSPWMGALLAEAMLRYYILSEDPAVLSWLSGMGDFIQLYAIYDGGVESSELAGRMMPWYLVGPSGRIEDGRGWGDMEHACDVAGLVAKAAWAKRRLGLNSSAADATTDDLLATCAYVLDYWHRSTPDLAEYRLNPARKFSWWFGSSTDLAWMRGQ